MKHLALIMIIILPMLAFSQHDMSPLSPLSYSWKLVGNNGEVTFRGAYPSIAFGPDSLAYVGFLSETPNGGAALSKFDGNNWISLISGDFSPYSNVYNILRFSPVDSLPYMAFIDGWTKVTVLKYNGSGWSVVGSESFTPGEAGYLSFDFNHIDGKPYVSFRDESQSGKASVMKFNGTNWVNVGNAGFSSAPVTFTSIAFDATGIPYVAFSTGDSANAAVMRYTSIGWTSVGSYLISPGWAYYLSLTFTSAGQPYVAYCDEIDKYDGKLSVQTFDGTSWNYVGSRWFSHSDSYYMNLRYSPLGDLYVSFSDMDYWCPSVMKYNGSDWVQVGSTCIYNEGRYTSLAFSPTGAPYITFQNSLNVENVKVLKYDSVLVGTNQVKMQAINIYPNPAIDKIIVDAPADWQNTTVSIINLYADEVVRYKLQGGRTGISISSLPRAVYFIKIAGEKGERVFRIVKQ